ncbi:ATP-binding cassette subfamily C protein [Methylobacterium persicinum]|uniref:ATP-binding cassette subfamily C protein n=1 Tax=Methylobacterium persicinum TaxID=374426 RepID=A0ABU0HM18_9HYPH|nr:ATP-binding cassette subfamily C protein [Methylobacterium persicinum]
MSGTINVLYLTGSFFMLEVYDRVIPSRSVPTLIGLSAVALGLYVFHGVLETVRGRLLARLGAAFDERFADRVFAAVIQKPRTQAVSDGRLPLRDLDQVRTFLGSGGLNALFDLPWTPLYIGICYLFHPLVGLAALAGLCALLVLTAVTDLMTRNPTRLATEYTVRKGALAEAGHVNAESLLALGMHQRHVARWSLAQRDHRLGMLRIADVSGACSSASKIFRMALQSGVLALGAWLVIEGKATAGIIIASSIMVSRALAPAELAIAHWKGFVAAHQSWRRLAEFLGHAEPDGRPMRLPSPKEVLSVESVGIAPPDSPRMSVIDASFRLQAGQAMAVIGPSASGKSTLVRAIVGVWRCGRGKIRLDGASLDQWPPESLGPHVGYLSQDVELLAGTVAENIARFLPDAPPERIIAAAQAADVHDMILHLPDGYDTRIAETGAPLSTGQRQRIGLARALFGDPFLVVLDEPNSNLDSDGEGALTRAIVGVRQRGGICIVVAHRASALAAVDQVLVMAEGRIRAFGPRDEVLRRVLAPVQTGGVTADEGGPIGQPREREVA